ncbi:MAG TPA: DUF5667 domain-containing protein [Patescibacteria group bacterium]|nr:DUF5667 domain-containing protein [Patescibacteria group bacterium]
MDQVEKKIIETLKSLRNDPDFGASLDYEGIHRRSMLRNGFDVDAAKTSYTLRDYVETYLWQFTHSMLKPMAAVMAVFVFAVAGSISVVGASGQALPGDQLYAVKVGVEKVQLALAIDAQARSQLRVEFASRRLEEMVQLAAQVNSSESGSVQLAANRFKTEVTNIQQELSGEGQTEFAKTVGRKVEVYSSTVTSSSADLPDEVLGEVEEILEETKDQVVEVIITSHEALQDEDSAHELDSALDAEIQSAVTLYGDAVSEAVATAEALRAEGLYRRAFQVLKDFTFEMELK